MIRKHIYFSGHVQGVGFRYTTLRLAGGYDITGFVRNLPDNRVELVVEGSKTTVSAFLEAIWEYMQGYIRQINQREEPVTATFTDFTIKY